MSMKSGGSAIEQGMFYAVVCSEDIPFLPPEGETGDYFFYKVDEYWRAACDLVTYRPRERGGA
jgi:hypothetical protein